MKVSKNWISCCAYELFSNVIWWIWNKLLNVKVINTVFGSALNIDDVASSPHQNDEKVSNVVSKFAL